MSERRTSSGKNVRKKLKKDTLEEYHVSSLNTYIRPGDTVMLRPPDPDTLPYIARVEQIKVDNSKHVTVHCRWYYRPEESKGGRRKFHGSKELFLSDHYDTCTIEAIEGTCTVHTFNEYIELSSVEVEDYFCRFEYNASSGKFSPDQVPVYCKCELPYNPDELMVQCENCKDWYHPTCVDLDMNSIKKLSSFYCHLCKASK